MTKARKTSMDEVAYTVKEVKSWKEIQDIVAGRGYRNWAFRGQADAGWPLSSTLTRYLQTYHVNEEAWKEQEWRIVRIFRRKAHLFLDHVPSDTDDFQWLALMQHHGAPTRLLDFTWSPFVAAFFALERATSHAAIWAVCIPEIGDVKHKFPGVRGKLCHEDLDFRTPDNYRQYFLGNHVPFVVYGDPIVMNQRLVAQAGTFLVPGAIDKPVDEILSGYPNPKATLVKFVIDTDKIRDEAMYTLYNMNITNATLFPGLDGMARSLNYELETHWAFNPKTMERYLRG